MTSLGFSSNPYHNTMRCPDCNKFVSYEDDPTIELNSLDVMDNGVVADVSVQLCCSQCGTTLREASLLTELALTPDDHTCEDYRDHDSESDDEAYDADDLFVSSDEGSPEPTVRNVNGKTFYGFRLETQLRCKCCDDTFMVELKDDTASSNFEDAV